MATIKLILSKGWRCKDGTYSLVFQVIHRRRKRVLYTKYKVSEYEFDPIKQVIIHSGCSSRSMSCVQKENRELNRQRKKLQQRVRMLEESGKEYEVEDVVFGGDDALSRIYFLQFITKQIEYKRLQGKEGIARAYYSSKCSFAKFLNGKDIRMSEITSKLMLDYHRYLSCRGVALNTIAFYMRNLRSLYDVLIKEGYRQLGEYPFAHIRTAVCKTVKRALDCDVICRIVQMSFCTPEETHLEFARDMFMFSFYCRGMSFVDIAYLKKENCNGGAIVYQRRKTNQNIRIALTPPIQLLINKYDNDSVWLFPIMNEDDSDEYSRYKSVLRVVNNGLRQIGERLHLDYKITSYMARHTWATLAKSIGTPISVISEGLGHTSEKTTQIYLKDFEYDIIDKVAIELESIVTSKKSFYKK